MVIKVIFLIVDAIMLRRRIDFGNITVEILTSAIMIPLALFIGYIMNTRFTEQMEIMSEIRDSDVIGVQGTLYALITTFILVNEWNQYNETASTYSMEAEAIMNLWSFIDFLDNEEISSGMRFALISYIDYTLSVEFVMLKQGRKVKLPSLEYSRILRLLDMIEYDEPSTSASMGPMVSAFKDLSDARSKRIDQSLRQIPLLIKLFYILSSVIFWFGTLIQGFDSDFVYYFVLFTNTLIVVFAYLIIFDLDKPLNGLLRLSLDNYLDCKNFIKETIHET